MNKNEPPISGTKLRGLALWGAIIGLLGGMIGIFVGGISFLEKFIPPSVEIIDVLPIFVHGKGSREEFPKTGISVIVHFRTGWRKAVITGIEFTGKQYLTFMDWLPYIAQDGKKISDFEKEDFAKKRPYNLISWMGWMEDSKVPVDVGPHEERFIRFTFLEATDIWKPLIKDEKYIGFDDGTNIPSLIKYHPQIWSFFNIPEKVGRFKEMPTGLRDETKNGILTLKLRVGSQTVTVPPEKYRKLIIIALDDWNTKTEEYLFYDQYN